MSGVVHYELVEGVAWLTIDRPAARNALDAGVRAGLWSGVERFNEDTAAAVLVLTGAGDVAFCAGADLKEMTRTGLEVPPVDFMPQFGRNVVVEKPTIACVNGVAYAGGFLLAQMCDLCVAAEHARFAVTEVKVGRGSPWAAPLVELIPRRVALQILLTGEPLDANRAHEIGLVNQVVPLASLRQTAQALARRIASNAPLSVRAAKAMVNAVGAGSRAAAFEEAERIWEPVYRSSDAQEGPRAFREKRSPPLARVLRLPVELGPLCDDLTAETTVLVDLLVPLEEAAWAAATPAQGWDVRDQVTHLAYFDQATVTAATDPDRFRAESAEARAVGEEVTEQVALRFRELAGPAALAWFRAARARLIEVARALDPSVRLPWYGPEMSAPSLITARIMETWAHGQDVADALKVARPPTPALRQVAHLGVRTLGNSFVARGLDAPMSEVRVELVGPEGERWAWGPPTARDAVSGPALDFCLVVTQRRHLADTSVVARGPVAKQWLSIAQAFAGPAGSGRRPGQFRAGAPGSSGPESR